jgi:glutathione peroxidase
MADLAEMWKYATMLVAAFGMTVSPPVAAGSNDGFSFAFKSIEGDELPLAKFKGKPVLVVNTASECGYTPQYKDLQAVWERYRDRGLIVLGVPSNDFGGQEPGTEAEIKRFCERQYAVDFPLTAKVRVAGGEAHPFYQWVTAVAGEAAAPRWNFHKYLVGPDGDLAAWFPTKTSPIAEDVTAAIEAALP